MRRSLSALSTAMMAALLAAACGSSGPSTRSAGTAPARSTGSALTGSLTVFAAASLTEPFNDDKDRLVGANPGLSLTYSFAGSQQLVSQISAGAPADVVATADQDSMAKLVAARVVEPPTTFATNALQIVVPRGNPKAVKGLADLSRADLTVVLADPSVPAGRYAGQALDRKGVTAKPASLELDVKSVLRKVSSGEADAGIVYVTDVKAAGSSVAGVDIPSEDNVVATYPVAVVKGTGHRGAALAFVDQLLHGPGQAALVARGFLSP
jgi:molybdate transport system substrate-binding protein